jgi:hypothetical protein
VPENFGEALSRPGGRAIEAAAFVRTYQLVYCSTSLIPPLDAGGDRHIVDILKIATSRNAKSGVTGALTFNDFYFAQVLEGPHEAVQATFDGILRDKRHTKIVVLQQGWVEARNFSRWAMAYVGDEKSLSVVSANMQLRDILCEPHAAAAMALVEMMRFWLVRSP